MRSEKQFLVEEVSKHLGKSSYVYLVDFRKVTVENAAELRGQLAPLGAEFHVVKNSILNVAAKGASLPDLEQWLAGQTGIVIGGAEAPAVAKVLVEFFKKSEKLEVKVGVIDGEVLSGADVTTLSNLPSKDVLRSQLLALLNTPATQFVRVLQATPEGLLNVLQAKSEQAA